MIYCIAALFFVLGVIVGRAHERRRKSKIIARQREILVETPCRAVADGVPGGRPGPHRPQHAGTQQAGVGAQVWDERAWRRGLQRGRAGGAVTTTGAAAWRDAGKLATVS